MTTPNNNTSLAIIANAYVDAGLLGDGVYPDSAQLVKGLERLTDIINFEQTQGLKLWLNTDLSIPLVASQASYSLGPAGDVVMTKPTRAIQGYYLDTSNTRRPLDMLSRDDYTRLSNTVQPGTITGVFIDKQATELVAKMWMPPDATAAAGTVHLIIQRQVTGPITVTETLDFPIEWRLFARWALAEDLSTGQPQSIMDRCAMQAAKYRAALEDWDVEDADTRFEFDAQGYSRGIR